MESYMNETIDSNLTSIAESLNIDCHYVDQHLINIRFWLVSVVGTTIAFIAILFNTFLFLLFITNRSHRNSPSLYLLLLAFFDVFMGVAYILVMSGRVIKNYYGNLFLQRIWMSYVVIMMVISHIAMTASSYLIVFATLERYMITIGHRSMRFLRKYRKILALFAVLLGFFSKGTIFIELHVSTNEECIGTFNEYILGIADFLTENYAYNTYWKFYYRNIVTVLLPFFLLMIFNIGILNKLRKKDNHIMTAIVLKQQENSKARKIRIRAATRTTVLVGLTYLFSNALNVIITIWEHVDATALFEMYFDFYVISVDLVSVLTVVASAMRIIIYASCQTTMRSEIKIFWNNGLKNFICYSKKKAKSFKMDTSSEEEDPTELMLKNKQTISISEIEKLNIDNKEQSEEYLV
uniref:G_PROTEIN_RECEP_F1_2 domain-containing protein n=1 Tax=Parastrongyloides trichosuri TaxID=131310 RepID=A0A0N4ZYT2_PARTI